MDVVFGYYSDGGPLLAFAPPDHRVSHLIRVKWNMKSAAAGMDRMNGGGGSKARYSEDSPGGAHEVAKWVPFLGGNLNLTEGSKN